MIDIHPGDVYSAGKEKVAFAQLNRFGVTKDSVDIIDEERGLIGITFWLQNPQEHASPNHRVDSRFEIWQFERGIEKPPNKKPGMEAKSRWSL